jgi:hypothetical protein
MESLDLLKVLDGLKRGAQVIDGDLVNLSLGAEQNPALLYAEPLERGVSSDLAIQNIMGFGVLLVRGNVRISAPFYWEGLVVVSGQATFDGGLGTSAIHGALYADQVQMLSGDVAITLDTCPIATTLRVLPVAILNWKQLL